ncbi:MAG: peptidoglycan-binding protein [Acidimicrobiales bacterium]
MRDLQQRLARLGFDTSRCEPGTFAQTTVTAVQAFQAVRGLREDGVCGAQTWAAVVEASYRLGDRLLYLREPMLRGDDVAALQRRLGGLGFDAGRVDAILGPNTKLALDEFQRNAGLTVDGVCGPGTLTMLDRLGPSGSEREPVAVVRELELLRQAPRTLHDRRIAVGDGGGLHAAVGAAARTLTRAGAEVVVLQHPDQSEQATEANAALADVYVGLRLDVDAHGCTTAHYAGHHYVSPAGRRLALLVQATLPPALGIPDRGVRGMALPALKETRMPAVVCELGPPSTVVARTAELADALARALGAWASAPIDDI